MKPHRSSPSRLAWTASLVVAAGGGWAAHDLSTPATPDEALAAIAARADGRLAAARPVADRTSRADATPLIAMAADGNVTIRVEQQPLPWVLEQLAREAGWPELAAPRPMARPASARADGAAERMPVAPAGAACPPPWVPADPTRLLQAIDHGPEPERMQALFRARAEGIALPDTLLRTLVETAPSDELRLAALETWLDRQADDLRGQRSTLLAALQVPHAAVQREARQRLDDLLELQRLDMPAARASP